MPDDSKPSLAYDRPASGGVTRWQFRLLLLLVVVNLAITIQTAYAPQVATQVRQRWASYQWARQWKATHRQGLAFSEPATKVVWDDHPDTAAKLLAGPGYRGLRVEGLQQYSQLARWPKGAVAVVPPAVDSFHRLHFGNGFPNLPGEGFVEPDAVAAVFLRPMKTPGGEDRLVFVYVTGGSNLNSLQLVTPAGKFISPVNGPPSDRAWNGVYQRYLRVQAVPCRLSADGKTVTPSVADGGLLTIHPATGAAANQKLTWAPPTADGPEQIRLTGPGQFRFYAGQLDPADPTHFTVDYDVDDTRGTIHGRIAPDGTVRLEPTTGRVVGSQWHFGEPAPGAKAK